MKPRQIYAWISENRGGSSVALCCAALKVRREGYCSWEKRASLTNKDEALISALKQAREANPCYGVQSLIDTLPDKAKVSYGKGYKICRDNGLLQYRRKHHGITVKDPMAQTSEDLIKRDFTAERPGEKWLTDITQIQCKDGKLYLNAVLDCFDAVIVGLSMDTGMKAPLCSSALISATARYGHADDCIVHSDKGSQFTSRLYRETLAGKGFRQSMGHTGSCYDNARMESFFATLKKELLYRLPLYKMTRDEIRGRIFEWVECYYNRRRRHTANESKLAPLVKRELYIRQHRLVA